MSLTTGTILQNGKYVLDTALGQAGFGITYRANSTRLEQPVVIKTLNEDLQGNSEFGRVKQRFLEEARQLSQCQHPNIARAVDVFEEANLPFLVMDYVTGQSLSSVVQSGKPLPEVEALHCIRQVGSALRLLHQTHLLHRGIKPKNLIRCERTNFVVLVGFSTAQGFATQTVPQQGVLSAGYAALEQYFPQKELTPATDVYGLAATLYFLVTGKAPIAAPLRDRQPMPSPRELRPDLSREIEQAILQGLAVDAHLRPQSVPDWLALLPGGIAAHSLNGAGQVTLNGAGRSTPPGIGVPQASPSTTSAPTLAVAPGAPLHTPVASNVPAGSTYPVTLAPGSAAPVAAPAFPKLPKHWWKLLGMTSAIAIVVGISLGLAMRLSGSSGPGSTLFNTEQSFPPSDKWPGTPLPDEPSETIDSGVSVPQRSIPDPDPAPIRQIQPLPPSPPPVRNPTPTPDPSPAAVDPSPSPDPASQGATDPAVDPALPPADPTPPDPIAPSVNPDPPPPAQPSNSTQQTPSPSTQSGAN